MKIYQILICAILIFYVQNTCQVDSGINKASDCHSRELSPDEQKRNKYCCYLYYTHNGEEGKECVTASIDEYNNIDSTITTYQGFFSITVKSFDCKSAYLQIGLLSLLFFLF